jgi:hypothetical protein
MRYQSTTINPDHMTVGEATGLTEEEDQTGVRDHASLMPPQGTKHLSLTSFPSVARACQYPTSLRARLRMSHGGPHPWTHRGPRFALNLTGTLLDG